MMSFLFFSEELREDVLDGQDSLPIRYYLKKKQLTDDAEEDVLLQNFALITQNLEHTHAGIDHDQFLEGGAGGKPKQVVLYTSLVNEVHTPWPICFII